MQPQRHYPPLGPLTSGVTSERRIMKRSVAAWLLVGLSLGVPQFCKGEATAPGAGCGTGRESPGKRCAGGWRRYPGRSRGGERRGRHRGGCALPCVPRKSARKVREEYAGLSREEGVGYPDEIEEGRGCRGGGRENRSFSAYLAPG